MECQGFYEAEVLDKDGELVQYFEGKNTVSHGFIGGLFKHLFNVGDVNAGLNEPNKTPYRGKAQFGYLFLFKTGAYEGNNQIQPDEPDTPASYTTDLDAQNGIAGVYAGGVKKLFGETSDLDVNATTVVMDTSTSQKKITLVLQVTFSPTEGIAQSDSGSSTWLSMGIGSITDSDADAPISVTKLVSRVFMGAGVQKTNTQTLRVRYNFSIVVSTSA